jgi:hypothetical protein
MPVCDGTGLLLLCRWRKCYCVIQSRIEHQAGGQDERFLHSAIASTNGFSSTRQRSQRVSALCDLVPPMVILLSGYGTCASKGLSSRWQIIWTACRADMAAVGTPPPGSTHCPAM